MDSTGMYCPHLHPDAGHIPCAGDSRKDGEAAIFIRVDAREQIHEALVKAGLI
jgi:hypothetical protein